MTADSPLEPEKDLLALIDAAPSPYHAVAEVGRRLRAAGFRELDEREAWKLSAGDRAFVVRAGGSIVAFVVGSDVPANAGFLLVGAHTDSPNLRIKPRPDQSAWGFRQLGVETYGSVLLYTWLDRDLSLAGRVTLTNGETHLVRLPNAVCRIPNLAIHLNPTLATNGLQLNPQQHAVPILALEAHAATDLRMLVAAELGRSGAGSVTADRIASFDLCLYDVQPASLGGANGEFLFAPRLDNLASCHAAISALLRTTASGPATRVVALLDHEEVGSQSAAGAQSRFLVGLLERITVVTAGDSADAVHRALSRSLMVSADMAHAVHPNFADRHDASHGPRIGLGPVIKVNVNQSYATDGPGAALFEQACRESGFSPQHFVSRNDMRCGTTIGPISAARTGIRTIDVGNPMLSMHSCREMAGTADVSKMISALSYLFSGATVPPPHV